MMRLQHPLPLLQLP